VACEICGSEGTDPGPCPRCGYPGVSQEGARALKEAADLAAAGALDKAIRKLQQAVRSAPESYLPRLRLAQVYERMSYDGAPALLRLAEKEIGEAMRLGPAERDVHVLRLSLAAKLGRLPSLKEEYRFRSSGLPFSGECLRMIDALERIGSPVVRAPVLDDARAKARYFFLGAAGAGVTGLMLLALVVYRSMGQERVQVASVDFVLCAVLFTTCVILVLEGFRAREALKGKGGK